MTGKGKRIYEREREGVTTEGGRDPERGIERDEERIKELEGERKR